MPVHFKPLSWRKPRKNGADFGFDEILWIANGVGGKYSISKDSGGFLLWGAEDEFLFEEFDSVAEAKGAAERDWQERLNRYVVPE